MNSDLPPIELIKIRIDIEKALETISQKHNLKSLTLGKIHYANNGFGTYISGVFEHGESIELKQLKLLATQYGLNPKIANKTIQYSQQKCKVIGLVNEKLLLEVNGQMCMAPIEHVIEVLKKQQSPYLIQQLVHTEVSNTVDSSQNKKIKQVKFVA